MKESKFIELLNLYVDQEISQADAALLEQEIQSNPERRKVYQQYCRMHRASVVLCESFRSEAVPSGSKLARAARNVDAKLAGKAHSSSGGWSWAWFSAGGLVAAAACVAFILVRMDHQPKADPISPSLASTPTPKADLQPVSAVVPVPQVEVVTPVLVARSLEAKEQTLAGTSVADSSLDWVSKVDLPPMRGMNLDTSKLSDKNSLKVFPIKYQAQPQKLNGRVEMGAFQFQR